MPLHSCGTAPESHRTFLVAFPGWTWKTVLLQFAWVLGLWPYWMNIAEALVMLPAPLHASGTASCFRQRIMLAGSAWDPSQFNAAQAKRPQLMG